MCAPQPAFRPRDRREAKALVVAISALQLTLIVAVWLLALVPAAFLALGAMAVQGLRRREKRPRAAVVGKPTIA